MSLLEQLIRQLGSVEIDPTGLRIEVDGKPISVNDGIKITVMPAVAAEPVAVDEEEWEWQIAMARARANADDAAQEQQQLTEHMQRIERLQRVLKPTIARAESPLQRRPRLGSPNLGEQLRMIKPRRVAHGTAPPVPTDDDVTKPIDIRPISDRPHVERMPPPLPPPPDE